MRVILLLVLLVGCADPIQETPIRAPLSEFKVEAEPEVVELEVESDAEIELVDTVAAMTPPPFMQQRYVDRCREESRRDGVEAETIGGENGKDEARRRAQHLARRGQLDPLLIFARMAYGEEGPPVPGKNDDGYFAMLAVMDSLRGRGSRLYMFVSYSPRRVFPHPEDRRQRWIAELELDGRRPPSWPAPRGNRFHPYPQWRSYGCPRWLATVDAVRSLMRRHRGNVGRGPCTEVPDHWGGDMDTHNPSRGDWRNISCGNTEDIFWVVPSRAERRRLSGHPEMVEGAAEGAGDNGTQNGLRSRASQVQGTSEGVQWRSVSPARPVVLDLHRVPRNG